MLLIEIFTDYIVNKKSLKEYVELRKTINQRGEFNDATLLQADENLQRLKQENPEIYDTMYAILSEVMRRDQGHTVEYPLDFTREILKLYKGKMTPEEVCEEYRHILEHRYRDA